MKYWEPQVEAIHSYNTMKDNLMEYLAKFASSKKVVREEDIKEFFDGMKKNTKFYYFLLLYNMYILICQTSFSQSKCI